MTTDYQIRVTPQVAASEQSILQFLADEKGVDVTKVTTTRIVKRSIDARQRNIFINLTVRVYINEFPSGDFQRTVYPQVDEKPQVLVIGEGPGGLFAALRLIELGYKPIVLERGKNVHDRKRDMALIAKIQKVDEESNYCFGEGGAGAYSDGKLFTRSKKRGNVDKILNVFCQHGASTSILVDAHPHIGTDKLPRVIENMRNTILGCGGQVHFQTKMTSLITKGDTVVGVEAVDLVTGDQRSWSGPVILATGHSARDVYRYLYRDNIEIEAKGIAVGVRLEHPAMLIDQIQYHSSEGRGEWLPAAEYSFVTQVDGRGVYSFCMCPGGIIVPAASGPNQLVVNGMSPSNRGSRWANSGMVVEIRPEDVDEEYAKYGNLKMMAFQEDLEKLCYEQAGKTQNAGAQRMRDFVEGRASVDLPRTSYAPGTHPSRLDKWLPEQIGKRLQQGFRKFGSFARGFLTNEAILIGVESRTSSPVRIPRDRETMVHIRIDGLYPCGEGAGYAGGIVSAAMDGEKCAEAVAKLLNN